MHRKYARDGFAAVSVSLDDPRDAKLMANVERFLKAQNATFTNVVLDEKVEFWQKKLGFDGPPCIFVFNREGRWTKFDAFPEYAEIEKVVLEHLKKKAP
jgi:hypothetical protein